MYNVSSANKASKTALAAQKTAANAAKAIKDAQNQRQKWCFNLPFL